ncbi:MAG: hypothetical protein Q7V19_03705 [Bacteroidales bacterium]|nr:hypothetical protein [Bacteroidales bacterium]MDP2238126.1 hypothetical protein [Bacteroidales bacterium]
MQKTIYISILVFWVSASFAQDTIYKSDGNIVKAFIKDKSADVIHYNFFENPSGPTFILHKNYIDSVRLENGMAEVYPKIVMQKSLPKNKSNPDLIDFKQNIISYNAFDLVFEMITFNYEHVFKSGNYGLRIPLSFTFIPLEKDPVENYIYYYDDKNAKFGTGIDFIFYPFGQQPYAWYVSAAYEYKLYKFYETYWNYSWPSQYLTKKSSRVINAFLFQTGYILDVSEHFNFGLNIGVGYRFASKNPNYGGDNGPLIRGGLSLGYKF